MCRAVNERVAWPVGSWGLVRLGFVMSSSSDSSSSSSSSSSNTISHTMNNDSYTRYRQFACIMVGSVPTPYHRFNPLLMTVPVLSPRSLHQLAAACVAKMLQRELRTIPLRDARAFGAYALHIARRVRKIGYADKHYPLAYLTRDGRVVECTPEHACPCRDTLFLVQLYCTADMQHMSNVGSLFQTAHVELQLVPLAVDTAASSPLVWSSLLKDSVTKLFFNLGERSRNRELFETAEPYIRRILLI